MFLPFQNKSHRMAGHRLYMTIVEQARLTGLYDVLSVPDTMDGRFDILSLHVFLVISRLQKAGRKGRAVAQALFDQMFIDMDRSLREQGVGDLGVPKHIKRMMKAFNGRCLAYDAGLSSPTPGALREALARNVYRMADMEPVKVAGLADYARFCVARLASQADAALIQGTIVFPMEYFDEQTDRDAVDAGMVA